MCTTEDEPPHINILVTNEKSPQITEEGEEFETETKTGDCFTFTKDDLQDQQELQQRHESPDRQISNEPKITDTPKKDSSDKQQQLVECENVGSPRIILKIAKSALTDCSEPRSPKSPKIRSAANSPNPEDTSGHKLGKIKLKLSRCGHPSIISSSSDNYEETPAQWHTDNTSSEKPLGMKIKLTKSTESDGKHDEQKQEEVKEKSTLKGEECRKTEALKIKLSKSGDASIIHQDHVSKENLQEMKHRDIKETVQVYTTSYQINNYYRLKYIFFSCKNKFFNF